MRKFDIEDAINEMANMQEYSVVIGRDLSDDNFYHYDENTHEKVDDDPIAEPIYQFQVWDVDLVVDGVVHLDNSTSFDVLIPVPETDSIWLENLMEMAQDFACAKGAVFPEDSNLEYTQTFHKSRYSLSAWWQTSEHEYSIDMMPNLDEIEPISGAVLHHDYVRG